MIPAIDVPVEVTPRGASVNNSIQLPSIQVRKYESILNEADESRAVNKWKFSSDSRSLDSEYLLQRHKSCQKNLDRFNKQEMIIQPRLIEKSVIVHKDENGFGLRLKGQTPVFVDHVHENGAAWRAGVRRLDILSRVNGHPVYCMDHKDVVLMFKGCTRFISLTLLSSSIYQSSANGTDINSQQLEQRKENDKHAKLSIPPVKHSDQISLNWRLPFELTSAYNESHIIKALLSRQNFHYSHLAGPRINDKVLDEASQLVDTRQGFGCPQSNSMLQLQARNSLASSGNQSNSTFTMSLMGSSPSSPAFNRNSTPFEQESQGLERHHRSDNHPRRSESLLLRPSYLISSGISLDNSSSYLYCRTCGYEQFKTGPSDCQTCGSLLQEERQQNQTETTEFNESEAILRPLKSLYGYPKENNAKNDQVSNMNEVQGKCNQNRNFNKLSQSISTSSLPTEAIKTLEINNSSDRSGVQVQATRVFTPKPMNRRLEIVREFIDTERSHTERLRYLEELFYRPIKINNLMTTEQLRQVFSCHRTLYKIHRQIYRILLSANCNINSEPLMGSALLEIFEGDFKRKLERAACTFCATQSTNTELLNKLTRRDTKVGEFIAQVTSQQMIGKLGIKDLLASCFQRLTKYPLLLENLLKATPKPQSITSAELERFAPNIRSLDETRDDNVDSQEANETFQSPEQLEKIRTSQRMLAISLEEEREFITRALNQSRQILLKVNEAIRVAVSHDKLKEIWKRTDKYPGVPLIDITKQQVVHEGLLTLRLSKRSFDVYVLLLNDYIIILTREGQDKYRLKFFTPDGKGSSSSNNQQSVYSPVFVIDEHLTTRDAATDENGFYLLCKRKDDSRIYEFASRSPAERIKWRDKIQWTIDVQMSKNNRRPSCISTITKSSSEISTRRDDELDLEIPTNSMTSTNTITDLGKSSSSDDKEQVSFPVACPDQEGNSTRLNQLSDSTDKSPTNDNGEPTKIEGTISYVEDDGIVMPSKLGLTRAFVDQAVQVSVLDNLRKSVETN